MRNKKKKLAVFIGLVGTLCILLLAGYIFQTIKKKSAIAAKAETLPAFTFSKLDGGSFTRDSLAGYKGRLIVEYFSPDCEHCQYMAKQYYTHQQQLKESRILMVSFSDSLSIRKFSQDYQLNTMPNILILRDPKLAFTKFFGVGVIPSLLVYVDNKLVNRFVGETTLDNLLSDIQVKN